MNKRTSGVLPSSSQQKVLLSMEEAAELMSIGRTLLYDLVMHKRIASIKIGRSRRIPVMALYEFIAQQASESEP